MGKQAPPTRAASSLVRALRDARGALPFATGTTLNQRPTGVLIGCRSGVPFACRLTPSNLKGIGYAVTLGEGGVELGNGWNRTSSKGNAYVSVMLDSPFMPQPANCALVKKADGFLLLWNRPRVEAEGDDAEAESSA